MARAALDLADFRLLHVFVAIVEARGFAAAEARLGLGLSTISSHMKTLELRLGLVLCRRGRAGFALTEAGKVVYAEARQLIAASESFATRVAGLRDCLAGPVRVGLLDAIITDTKARIPEAISAYALAAPESEIRLISRPPDELLRDVS